MAWNSILKTRELSRYVMNGYMLTRCSYRLINDVVITIKLKNMRQFFVFLGLLVWHFYAQAQSTPEEILAQLPSVPVINCIVDTTDIAEFSKQIYIVKEKIKAEVAFIYTKVQKEVEDSLNNNNEEQVHKSIEKSISEQYGLSIQELKNVSEMSELEQEKWAQQYGSQIMAKSQKDPTVFAKKGNKAKRMFELANEQKNIGERIKEKMNRIAIMFKDVEIQDSIEILKLEEKIRPLENQLCSGICTDAEIARSIVAEKQIYALKIRYCEMMSPLQLNAISQYQTTLKTLFHDYRKLTEVENEVVRLQ